MSFRDDGDVFLWLFVFLFSVLVFLMQSKLGMRRCVSSGDEGDRRLRRAQPVKMCVKYNVIIWDKTAGCSVGGIDGVLWCRRKKGCWGECSLLS